MEDTTPRVILADVAKAAGVSASTASLAFSGSGPIAPATRERVLAAAARLGYSGPNPVARSLRMGSVGVVGVVVGDRLRESFRDPLQIRVLDGVANELGERGLGMLLIPTDPLGAPEVVPDAIRTAAMDVAIVTGSPADDPALVALRARGVPMVALDGPLDSGMPVVAIDDHAGMTYLVNHLTELGHTHIGVVSLPLSHRREHRVVPLSAWQTASYPASHNRLRALDELGVRPLQVVETTASLVEEGQRAGRELLALEPRPTAIIALSDFLASGVVLAARELELEIGGELSIVGFDGLDLPWLAPDVLTSIGQPLGHKGRLAAQLAASVMAGEPVSDRLLPVEFKRGTTTGPAREADDFD